MTKTARQIAIDIYRLFETHSMDQAVKNFDDYDISPKKLPREFSWLVKQSYAAADLAMKVCEDVCQEFAEEDEKDNGLAQTGKAAAAAEKIRELRRSPAHSEYDGGTP